VTPIIGWGENFAGQLEVPPDTGEVVAVAAGNDHSLALRSDGRVVGWGDNTLGQITIPPSVTNAVAVAAGGAVSVALIDNGTVVAWGDNRSGQTNVPPSVTNAMAIAASGTHCLALLADGTVAKWGQAANVLATSVVAIAATGNGSFTVNESGNLQAWGAFLPGTVTNAKAVAAYSGAGIALQPDGKVAAWATPFQGGLSVFSPDFVTNAAAVTASRNTVVALGSDGTIVWGPTNTPLDATNLVAVTAGLDHYLGLVGDARSLLAQQHSSKTVVLGESTRIVATSIGNAPATYQWQLNGLNLMGATNASLFLSPVRWTNAAAYRVIITDAFGSVTGPETVLSVLPTMVYFDLAPASLVMTTNGFQMRLLGASGTGPLVLYSSTNLVAWEPILTNPPTTGPVEFVAPVSPGQPQRFYRASEVYGP
jgi:alpha-tubulin suppressor-like RCC1 family protein